MNEAFHRFARTLSNAAGSPWAFALATFTCVVWAAVDHPFDWLDGISALTFWMLFSLQSSQNADTHALHRKLDELILTLPQPDDAIAGIEERPS